VLRDPRVSSALLGASSVGQLEQNVAALANTDFSRRGADRDRPLREATAVSTSGRPRAGLTAIESPLFYGENEP
jgi:hypothetical protein